MIPSALVNKRQTFKDQTNTQSDPNYAPSSSDFEECPTCSRSFNPTAYEKHVKIC